MGAWSHEPFGNDEANDWAYELEETEDLSHVEAALDAALNADGYLDASEATCAVAAVEVLAKLLGKGTQSDAYTKKIDEWVDKVRVKPSPTLLGKARAVLAKVRGEQSELKELWHDGDASEWEASLDSLHAAVST
jgi:hypothetical protein